jgi:hydrogenase nickel incorporation protein HypA/HybF
MSIVQALIDQVATEVRQLPEGGRVLGIDVVIGRMSGVHADSFRFAFELLSPGTLVEGAVLKIQEPGFVLACHACHARREADLLRFECPACGSPNVSVDGGQELLLQSIEVDENTNRTSNS